MNKKKTSKKRKDSDPFQLTPGRIGPGSGQYQWVNGRLYAKSGGQGFEEAPPDGAGRQSKLFPMAKPPTKRPTRKQNPLRNIH